MLPVRPVMSPGRSGWGRSPARRPPPRCAPAPPPPARAGSVPATPCRVHAGRAATSRMGAHCAHGVRPYRSTSCKRLLQIGRRASVVPVACRPAGGEPDDPTWITCGSGAPRCRRAGPATGAPDVGRLPAGAREQRAIARAADGRTIRTDPPAALTPKLSEPLAGKARSVAGGTPALRLVRVVRLGGRLLAPADWSARWWRRPTPCSPTGAGAHVLRHRFTSTKPGARRACTPPPTASTRRS